MLGKLISGFIAFLVVIALILFIVLYQKYPSLSLLGVNPIFTKDYSIDIPFSVDPSGKLPNGRVLNPSTLEILGRPKKVVEFYCTSDIDCQEYFKEPKSFCDTKSGNCYTP